MSSELKKLMELSVHWDKRTADIANVVLDNSKFPIWTASAHPKVHHYGQGGLVKHTYEVVGLALNSVDFYSEYLGVVVDKQAVYLAGLFHDFGKIHDYSPKLPGVQKEDGTVTTAYSDWESTEDKFKVYHITRSAQYWCNAFDKYGGHLPPEMKDEVLHAILAHHGRLEYKSPVTPRTKLAWVIHCADQLSARYTDCDFKRDFK